MAWLKRVGLSALLLCVSGGCSRLTEPPKEEAIQSDPSQATGGLNGAPSAAQPAAKPAEQPKPAETAPPSNEKLEIKDLVVGKGTEAKTGDSVKVHYVGTLPDGKEFDSSKKHNQPFDFELGAGRVIKGWDQGVVGMKVGGRRKLVIPPHLGYGERGAGTAIGPGETLVFVVDLLDVR